MAQVVTSNNQLHNTLLRIRFNMQDMGCFVHLFKNNITPGPATVSANFVEADFAGYSPVAITTTFPLPIKVRDGLYQSNLPAAVFHATAGPTQTVYGWYLTINTVGTVYSGRFGSPWIFSTGVTNSITIQLQEAALFGLCP